MKSDNLIGPEEIPVSRFWHCTTNTKNTEVLSNFKLL